MNARRARFTDPVTGDPLTLGEEISWLAQGLIRRWTVLVALQVATVLTFIYAGPDGRGWWNLGASDAAIVIEGMVGIAMFSQTRRDAVILREVRKAIAHIERLLEK